MCAFQTDFRPLVRQSGRSFPLMPTVAPSIVGGCMSALQEGGRGDRGSRFR
jgi:hypothetical protein